MVLAPEHPLVDSLVPQGDWPEGTKTAWTGGDADAGRRRRGIPARGRRARATSSGRPRARTRPASSPARARRTRSTGERIPVFVADYVLMGYGTGAIMAVPGQDERDWEFADEVRPADRPHRAAAPRATRTTRRSPATAPAINSANDEISLDGLGVAEAKATIIDWLEDKGFGEGTINYKLRDWLFSRQRYWGEPFPIVYDEDGAAHAVPESMLPLELPEVPDYSPQDLRPGRRRQQPRAAAGPRCPSGSTSSWTWATAAACARTAARPTRCPTGPARAGTTCATWTRPTTSAFVDPDDERYWMGRTARRSRAPRRARRPRRRRPLRRRRRARGAAPAVRALLAQGAVRPGPRLAARSRSASTSTRATSRRYAYRDARGQPVAGRRGRGAPAHGDEPTFTWQGQPVTREYGKIGKSLKNVVTPDEMYDAYGADTFRVYEMSMGPLDLSQPWETRAVVGAQRFLQRLWRNVVDEETGEVARRRRAGRTTRR